MVQWLRFHSPNEGGPGSIPGQGTISHVLQLRASLVAQMVKNPTAMWNAWIRSLDLEDPLQKVPATHSSILVWTIPGTEEPGRL